VGDRWEYDDHGLLDRTHVHFFTAREAAAMLDRLGLEIAYLAVNDHAPLPQPMEPLAAVAAALGADRAEAAARLGAYQYLLVARRKTMSGFAPATPATVPGGGIENAEDPVSYLRDLSAAGGEVSFKVPNVKHWSVLSQLLVEDRWSNGPRWRFTLEAVSELLDEAGLEGTAVEPGQWVPLPPHLTPLLDLAVAAGAEREETLLRLGVHEYVVSAQLKRPAAD
jgi:hypothetical protein